MVEFAAEAFFPVHGHFLFGCSRSEALMDLRGAMAGVIWQRPPPFATRTGCGLMVRISVSQAKRPMPRITRSMGLE